MTPERSLNVCPICNAPANDSGDEWACGRSTDPVLRLKGTHECAVAVLLGKWKVAQR